MKTDEPIQTQAIGTRNSTITTILQLFNVS
jgi:hypothetical protein